MLPDSRLRFFVIALPGLLLTAMLAYGSDERSLRWLMEYAMLLGVGVLALGLPHLALPDRAQFIHQIANTPPEGLAQSQWRQWRPVVLGALVPAMVLAIWPPYDATRLQRGIVDAATIVGTGYYALLHYHQIGLRSQEWSEGVRGGAYRWVKTNTPYGVPLPDGLVPAFMSTGRVYSAGLAVYLAARILELRQPTLALAPPLLWLLVSVVRWSAASRGFDGLYYRSNAFFREIFTAGRLRVSDHRPLPFDSLYWVPPALRPATWISLVQLDRRLPLGRAMALGHGLFWLALLRDAPVEAVNAYLATLVMLQKASVFLIARAPLVPPAFASTYLPASTWVAVRAWINLRWTLPLAGSVALVALFDDGWGVMHILGWTLFDVTLSVLFALATYRRMRYAG